MAKVLLPAIGSVANACTDCWPMFDHDLSRSGLQTSATGINIASAALLQLRWSYGLGEQVVASPVIDGGLVFVSTGAGSIVAIDQRTGTPRWRTALGGPVTMTPTVSDGMLFVGTHTIGGRVYALDEQSGNVKWQAALRGPVRGSPAVVNGTVIFGQAGGDPPDCIQGGVVAYRVTTGQQLWSWNVDPAEHDGGSQWSPISYGGSDLVFGTGNTCSPSVGNANSLVRLDMNGVQDWQIPFQVNSSSDDDWGGAALLLNGNIYAESKAGNFFATSGRDGSIIFQKRISPIDGGDSFGSPTSDGSVIVVPTGFLKQGSSPSEIAASIVAFDLSGRQVWSIPTGNIVPGGVAITNGVGFASIDDRLVGINIKTGTELWSFAPPEHSYAYAGPAIVSTGVYYVDELGDVFAFSPGVGSGTGTPVARSMADTSIMRKHLSEPYGPILRHLANGKVKAVY